MFMQIISLGSKDKNYSQEEIATMQTLYQYRTYSIDSSEESSGESYFCQIGFRSLNL